MPRTNDNELNEEEEEEEEEEKYIGCRPKKGRCTLHLRFIICFNFPNSNITNLC